MFRTWSSLWKYCNKTCQYISMPRDMLINGTEGRDFPSHPHRRNKYSRVRIMNSLSKLGTKKEKKGSPLEAFVTLTPHYYGKHHWLCDIHLDKQITLKIKVFQMGLQTKWDKFRYGGGRKLISVPQSCDKSSPPTLSLSSVNAGTFRSKTRIKTQNPARNFRFGTQNLKLAIQRTDNVDLRSVVSRSGYKNKKWKQRGRGRWRHMLRGGWEV